MHFEGSRPLCFNSEIQRRIDEKVALSLSDSELIRLGVATIGERVRFQDLCKKGDTASGNASTSTSSCGLIQIEQPKQELD